MTAEPDVDAIEKDARQAMNRLSRPDACNVDSLADDVDTLGLHVLALLARIADLEKQLAEARAEEREACAAEAAQWSEPGPSIAAMIRARARAGGEG